MSAPRHRSPEGVCDHCRVLARWIDGCWQVNQDAVCHANPDESTPKILRPHVVDGRS